MIFLLRVDGIEVTAPVGVAADERRLHTRLTLSVALRYRAQGTFPFKLRHLIDYEAVRRLIVEEAGRPEPLLENLAGRIMTRIRKEFPGVIEGKIRVRKHHFSGAFPESGATVELRWPQE